VKKPDFLNPPDLKTIDTKHGYWMQVPSNVTVNIQGLIQEYTEYMVKPGWNLIGYPSVAERTPDEVFENVSDQLDTVVYYNPQHGDYDYYQPGNPSNTLTVMKPGSGYWVKVKNVIVSTIWSFDGYNIRKKSLHAELSVENLVMKSGDPVEGDTNIELHATIRNEGLFIARNVDVKFYQTAPGYKLLNETTISYILPHGSEFAIVIWPIVQYDRSIDGTRIIAVVDGSNVIPELNERNNEYERTFHVKVPDLTLSGNYIKYNPPYPQGGENVQIKAYVYNLGESTANNIKVQFKVKPEGGSYYSLGNYTISSLGVGSSTMISKILWNITKDHDVWIELDPDNTINESDEHNSFFDKLRVGSTNSSINYQTNPLHKGLPWDTDDLNASIDIRNNNSAPLEDATVEFWHTPPGGSKYLLSKVKVPYIEGYSVNVTGSNQSIGSVQQGNNNISIKVFDKYDNKILEDFLNLLVREKRPDFVVKEFYIFPQYPQDEYLAKNTWVTLKANVTNAGRLAGYYDFVFNAEKPGSSTELYRSNNNYLNVGQNYTWSYDWYIPSSGVYNLSAIVYPRSPANEEDSNNNEQYMYPLNISEPGIDFLPINITFDPPNPMENENTMIDCFVRNRGDSGSENPVKISILDNGREISSQTTPYWYGRTTLNCGGGHKFNSTGEHNITIVVDSDNGNSEISERNNALSASLSVRERPFSISFTDQGVEADHVENKAEHEHRNLEGKIKAWTMSDPLEGCSWKWYGPIPYYDCDYNDESKIRGTAYKTFKVDTDSSTTGSRMAKVTIYYKYIGLTQSFDTIFTGSSYWEVIRESGIMNESYSANFDNRVIAKDKKTTNKGSWANVVFQQGAQSFVSESVGKAIEYGAEVAPKYSTYLTPIGWIVQAVEDVYMVWQATQADQVLADDYYHTFYVPLEAGKTYTAFYSVESRVTTGGYFAWAYSDFYYHTPHNADSGGSLIKNRGIWIKDVTVEFE
jgi:hypothetical protein